MTPGSIGITSSLISIISVDLSVYHLTCFLINDPIFIDVGGNVNFMYIIISTLPIKISPRLSCALRILSILTNLIDDYQKLNLSYFYDVILQCAFLLLLTWICCLYLCFSHLIFMCDLFI